MRCEMQQVFGSLKFMQLHCVPQYFETFLFFFCEFKYKFDQHTKLTINL